jgi:hypothetical protein
LRSDATLTGCFKLATRNICHQAIFYHRDVFALLGGFDLRYSTHADYAFNLRCFGSARITTRYVPLVIADYEGTGASAARSDTRFFADQPRLVREHLGFLAASYHRWKLYGARNVKEAAQRELRRRAARLRR